MHIYFTFLFKSFVSLNVKRLSMFVEFFSPTGKKEGNLNISSFKKPFDFYLSNFLLPFYMISNLKPYFLLWFHSEKENLADLNINKPIY